MMSKSKCGHFSAMLQASIIRDALTKSAVVDLDSEMTYRGAVEFAEFLRGSCGHAKHEACGGPELGQSSAQLLAWELDLEQAKSS